MAPENDCPDASPPVEGFNMETNPFRVGRDYRAEPLSEFEINQLAVGTPGSSLPGRESMLNAKGEVQNGNTERQSNSAFQPTPYVNNAYQQEAENLIAELRRKHSTEPE